MGVQKGRRASTDKKKCCLRYRRVTLENAACTARVNGKMLKSFVGVKLARAKQRAKLLNSHETVVLTVREAMSAISIELLHTN